MLRSDDEELVDECRCCDYGTFELDLNSDYGMGFCQHCCHHQSLHKKIKNAND